MWNGSVGVAKETYTASLGEGVVPRPLMMPLVRGELVGPIWVRPLKVGQDEVVLSWETHDVATAREPPIAGPAPCLNMVLATRAGTCCTRSPTPSRCCPAAPRVGHRSPLTGGRPPRRHPAANSCRPSRPR